MADSPNKNKKERKEFKISPIRTFESDFRDTLKDQNESKVSLSLKEHQRRDALKFTTAESRPIKKILFLTLAVILTIAGIASLVFLWWQRVPEEPPRKIIETLLVADESITLNIDTFGRGDFVSVVEGKKTEPMDNGQVLYFKLIKIRQGEEVLVESDEFLRMLRARTPSTLLRSFTGENMFGLISLGEENVPFWITEVDSFQNGFSGILEWERRIPEDWDGVFEAKFVSDTASFKDSIVQNKDVRILQNQDGSVALLHTFLDEKTLLITKNPEAFERILSLFISSKQIR